MVQAQIYFWALIALNITSLLVMGLLLYLYMHQIQRRRLHQEQASGKMAQRYEQSLIQAQLDMQEAILRKISQEIHDNVGQVLSLAKLNLHLLVKDHKSEQYQTTEGLLSKAITDLRDLSRSLHGDQVRQLGLTEALQHQLNLMARSTGMTTQFICNETELPLTDEQVVTAFRMVQEALNNIIKHAGATQVMIHVYNTGGKTCIHISDDGKGFTWAQQPSGSGIGLGSLQQRAGSVDGQLQIRTAPGKGTDVFITLEQISL